MPFVKPVFAIARALSKRGYSTASSPRHLLSVNDLTPSELSSLVRNAATHKSAIKAGTLSEPLRSALRNKTVAMSMSKRSTRTRVSTESAISALGGTPMFLGKQDIQLGVNESLRDTAIIISSMTAGIVARVGPHSDVAGLAEYSSVPVINALSDKYHPMQTVADYLTMYEVAGKSGKSLGLEGLKVAWVGDANNVLFDLAIGAMKLGVNISVATPEGYGIPEDMRAIIKNAAKSAPQPGTLTETTVPEDAVKGADVLVTDTWVSMGQEDEMAVRLKAFSGYRVTDELAKRGGASPDWKFMHCLPRHAEEVSDTPITIVRN